MRATVGRSASGWIGRATGRSAPAPAPATAAQEAAVWSGPVGAVRAAAAARLIGWAPSLQA